ncbi:MAG TPA: ABC transporter permease [Acidimicrobiales bacterium]
MRFVRKKLVQLVFVLLAVTFLSFLMLNLLPGDTAVVVCGISCDEAGLAQTRADLGLDRPIPVRYAEWLKNTMTGDMGVSARNKQPVSEAIKERMPVTIELLIYSQFIALIVAIPFALIAAQRAGGIFDRSSTTIAFGLLSVPSFVIALVFILVFAVNLGWFPAVGYVKFTDDPLGNIQDLFLPALTLAVAEMAVYLRLFRTDLISTLQEDYITMAKAKGISSRRVLIRHAFRPSSFSLVTVAGLNFGRLIGGTLIVEVIFAINGLGRYLYENILGRDYIPVQGGVVVVAVGYVLINFAVDMFYAVIDPRIRHARALA